MIWILLGHCHDILSWSHYVVSCCQVIEKLNNFDVESVWAPDKVLDQKEHQIQVEIVNLVPLIFHDKGVEVFERQINQVPQTW